METEGKRRRRRGRERQIESSQRAQAPLCLHSDSCGHFCSLQTQTPDPPAFQHTLSLVTPQEASRPHAWTEAVRLHIILRHSGLGAGRLLVLSLPDNLKEQPCPNAFSLLVALFIPQLFDLQNSLCLY